MNCIVTGSSEPDIHHIKTRGAGGTDDPWNLMPISHAIHMMIHQKGLVYMANLYPAIRKYLLQRGWELDDFTGKWVRPKLL